MLVESVSCCSSNLYSLITEEETSQWHFLVSPPVAGGRTPGRVFNTAWPQQEPQNHKPEQSGDRTKADEALFSQWNDDWEVKQLIWCSSVTWCQSMLKCFCWTPGSWLKAPADQVWHSINREPCFTLFCVLEFKSEQRIYSYYSAHENLLIRYLHVWLVIWFPKVSVLTQWLLLFFTSSVVFCL